VGKEVVDWISLARKTFPEVCCISQAFEDVRFMASNVGGFSIG
jgi:hypothetical protein